MVAATGEDGRREGKGEGGVKGQPDDNFEPRAKEKKRNSSTTAAAANLI